MQQRRHIRRWVSSLRLRPCAPPTRRSQVLRRQREKDEELAHTAAEREADNARRALERKLQLQDKASELGGEGSAPALIAGPACRGATGADACSPSIAPLLLRQVECVEELKRRDAYERSKALRRIQDESERSRALLEERRQLQDQRRLANLTSAMQRQQIVQARRADEGWAAALEPPSPPPFPQRQIHCVPASTRHNECRLPCLASPAAGDGRAAQKEVVHRGQRQPGLAAAQVMKVAGSSSWAPTPDTNRQTAAARCASRRAAAAPTDCQQPIGAALPQGQPVCLPVGPCGGGGGEPAPLRTGDEGFTQERNGARGLYNLYIVAALRAMARDVRECSDRPVNAGRRTQADEESCRAVEDDVPFSRAGLQQPRAQPRPPRPPREERRRRVPSPQPMSKFMSSRGGAPGHAAAPPLEPPLRPPRPPRMAPLPPACCAPSAPVARPTGAGMGSACGHGGGAKAGQTAGPDGMHAHCPWMPHPSWH